MSTMTKPTVSAMLTSKEVAAYLSVSEATVSRWRTFKSGPNWVNVGTLKSPIARYFQADLDAWLSTQKVVHA